MRAARGSITKLGPDYYRVRVTGKAIDPKTGKKARPQEYVHGSRQKAEDVRLRLLMENGHDVLDSAMPFGSYVRECYMPDKEAQAADGTKFKRKTLSNYKSRLKYHILPVFENVPLKEINVYSIKRWLTGFDRKPTARACFAVLSSVLSHAVENMALESNPCLKMSPPEQGDYEPVILDDQDMEVYMYFFRGTSIEAAVLLAIGGGFRRGEICGLNVEDIDFATGATMIDDAYITDGGKAYRETTKTRKKRIVYLPMSIVERLCEILPDSGPVLPGDSDGRMYPDSVTRAFERIRDKMPAEVPRVPFKNLRHSSHTLAYEAGADMMGIQERGGWSSISTPQRYYLRPRGERDKAIAEAMDRRLSDGSGNGDLTLVVTDVEQF